MLAYDIMGSAGMIWNTRLHRRCQRMPAISVRRFVRCDEAKSIVEDGELGGNAIGIGGPATDEHVWLEIYKVPRLHPCGEAILHSYAV